MKRKPKTLKEFIFVYIVKHGPTQASVLRKAMYRWKHGTLDGFTSHYASYFSHLFNTKTVNHEHEVYYIQGTPNKRGEFRPAIITVTTTAEESIRREFDLDGV